MQTIRRNEFFRRALTWLRSQQSISTDVLPNDAVDPKGTGVARVRGWLVHPSTASRWGFAGLYGLAMGVMLLMFNPRAMEEETRDAIDRAGYTVIAGGAGCVAVAEVVRRRSRTPIVVELRSGSASIARESVDSWRRADADAELWLVAERSPGEDVLACAAANRVRCFIDGPRGFHETWSVHGHESGPVQG